MILSNEGMRFSHQGWWKRNILNERTRCSRQGVVWNYFFKRAKENFLSGGWVEIIFSNEQMRNSRQGGGWVEIISSNEQMRISRQGVVKQEYSKREDEMFSSGGWWGMIFKNWFNSKKSFFQARLFSLLNEKLVAKKDSADRASKKWILKNIPVLPP